MTRDSQLALAKNTPFFRHLGIEVVEAKDGYAKLRLDFKDYLAHPFGYFHGGALASLADSAGINAVFSVLTDKEKALTLEMKINYLRPVKEVVVYAEGRVIHKGRKSAVSEVDVRTGEGELVAKAIVTCAIS